MIGIGSEVGLEEDTSSERGEIPWSILSSDVGSDEEGSLSTF